MIRHRPRRSIVFPGHFDVDLTENAVGLPAEIGEIVTVVVAGKTDLDFEEGASEKLLFHVVVRPLYVYDPEQGLVHHNSLLRAMNVYRILSIY